jgi:hypothetical protein
MTTKFLDCSRTPERIRRSSRGSRAWPRLALY